MESREDESVATVGDETLEKAMKDLTREHEACRDATTADASGVGQSSTIPRVEQWSTIPESIEPSTLSPANPPPLSVSQSAPERTMENMVAGTGLTRAQSFQFMAMGDTQELTSQEVRVSKSMLYEQTLREGDDGFVNLDSEWDGRTSSQGFEQLLEDEEQDQDQEQNQEPETPFVTRDINHSIEISTVKKTPRYSQLFGAAPAPAMSASQLIDQTQQPSSPAIGLEIQSDPLEQRPSPNFNSAAVHSSPPQTWFSSPDLGRDNLGRGRSTAPPGEPRAWYRSMAESQELRDRREAQHLAAQPDLDEEDWTQESVGVRRERIRRALSENAMRVTAPVRPGARRTPGRRGKLPEVLDLATPAPRKHQRVTFEAAEDHQEENQELQLEGPEDYDTPIHDEDDETDDGHSIQDEYDEFAGNILSQAPEPNDDDASTVASLDDLEIPDEHPEIVEGDNGAVGDSTGEINGQTTQMSAIADSQPNLQQQRSEDQALIVSSHGKSQVPSSPPLLRVSSTIPEDSREASLVRTSTAPQEIPESDMADADASKPPAIGYEDEETEDTSRDGAPFSTARSHISGSVQSPAARRSLVPQSQRSQLTQPSPLRPFAHFRKEASGNGSFEIEADVDEIMQGVITEEDQQVWNETSDEPERFSKRRKIHHKAPSRNASSEEYNEGGLKLIVRMDEDADLGFTRPVSPPPSALRDSPNKANEMLGPVANDNLPPSESVTKREKAGSDAVSQLVRTRGTVKSKTKQVTYGRKARKTGERRSISRDQIAAVSAADDEDEAMQDAAEHVETHVPEGDGPGIPNPKRVFALFKGSPLAFYPATWVGSSPDGTTFRVRFDDDAETNIETQHVRTLDLRVDDSIKVNVAGLRNKVWRITGIGTPAETREERGLATDANGHIRVKVQAKSNRNSLANDASSEASTDANETREVFVEQIYLTSTMWPSFADREFNPPAKARADRAQTPLRQGTPGSEVPPSRSRRATISTAKAKVSGLRLSHLRDTSTSSTRSAQGNGIFSGMAFAVTYVSNQAEKTEVTRLINRHGGTILDGGFEKLFDLPNIGEPDVKSPRKRIDEAGTGLRLKDEHKDLGFVALIADKHSRRAKYMQALALGLPTLSGRWVLDSLDAAKNDTLVNGSVDPLPWERYLLPAGESAYLGGAVRSRTLQPHPIASAHLQSTIASRATLLHDGESVLIVAPKKDKAGWEKRRTYAFLTLALGAGEVKRVFDMDEAKALISEDPNTPKWLYVDGALAAAEKAHSASGKKRKRGAAVEAAMSNVRIVDDEFVVQSLILGALYE